MLNCTIQEDRRNVISDAGNSYVISELVIPLQERDGERRYQPSDRFFKVACMGGTRHKCQVLTNGKVDVY